MFKKKSKNLIIDYFGLELPFWLDSRKSLFYFFLIDTLAIYFLLTSTVPFADSNFNLFRILLLLFIWALVSYINGRYSNLNNIKSIAAKLYNLFTTTLITIIFVYLFDKFLIIFFKNFIPLGKVNTISILFVSYILQSSKFFINKTNKYKTDLKIIGSKEEIKKFKLYSRNYAKVKNIKIKPIKDVYSLKEDYLSIVYLGANYTEFLLNNSIKFARRLQILSPSEWCEKNLLRVPPEYINFNENNLNSYFRKSQESNWRFKRLFDITFSLLGLLIMGPIIIFFAILIKIEDNGPIFYSQYRTGLFGQKFKIIKLRSMKENAEKDGPVWAKKVDPRITFVGKFIRKTRIDELPQLWLVLTGQMSIIGPRPERPEIDLILIKEIPNYKLRYSLKPGLTGWAQVNCEYGASIADSARKFSYEIFYIKNQSIWLDLLICLKTLKLVSNMEGSVPR